MPAQSAPDECRRKYKLVSGTRYDHQIQGTNPDLCVEEFFNEWAACFKPNVPPATIMYIWAEISPTAHFSGALFNLISNILTDRASCPTQEVCTMVIYLYIFQIPSDLGPRPDHLGKH